MEAKLIRLTHKIAIQLHVVTEFWLQAASPETFGYTHVSLSPVSFVVLFIFCAKTPYFDVLIHRRFGDLVHEFIVLSHDFCAQTAFHGVIEGMKVKYSRIRHYMEVTGQLNAPSALLPRGETSVPFLHRI